MFFHYCRNQFLNDRNLMALLVQAGKSLNSLCECISAATAALISDDLVGALQAGDDRAKRELDAIYAKSGQACAGVAE